ncbi:hypothetical protein [Candidatus Odyssella acanthamoebae]|uniref:Uncharacterized protein n=1 Tax=Candidatus Odyssella acanthamoebae TaxID=91604 RepID=A0A077AXF0_9PROT|nr:hypothetical protein [Candidatus Paracaedibacter acanthamoebae]AIK96664.1 hypothetical protein ID47_07930 [Candidatus Paracaedibacter acanthamoebae]
MISHNELGHMTTAFNWVGMDRLIENTGQTRLGLVTNLASFKQDFTQLFASKLQHKTTAFAIAPATDPKHLPVSARLNMGKVTLWVQGVAGRFS